MPVEKARMNVRCIANEDGNLQPGYAGNSGTSYLPNGRWLIWSQLDQAGSDIMLLENFR